MDDSGLVGAMAALCVVLLTGVLGTGAFLYATDAEMKAQVETTDCVASINVVTIRTQFLSLEHDVVGIPDRQCTLLAPGDDVDYHIRSKHTTIYRAGGICVYDSESGTGCGAAATLV